MDFRTLTGLLGVALLTVSTSIRLSGASPLVGLGENSTCPIAVDCGCFPDGQNIPIPIFDQCDQGFYCKCADVRAILQRCPRDYSMLASKYGKLNAYSQECVRNEEFDCEKWIDDFTTPPPTTMPVSTSSTTALPPSRPTTPASSTINPDPKACPIQVECDYVGEEKAIPILDRCNNGYYCKCEKKGLALKRCPRGSIFSFKREIYDAYNLMCVNSEEFDCAKWIDGDTTPTLLTPRINRAHEHDDLTLISSSDLCPISAHCSHVGQKIPIPIFDQCNDGNYCECKKDNVLALKKCPYDSLFSKTRKKLDAFKLECVPNDDFDCEKWIAGLTTSPRPTTTVAPTRTAKPTTTTAKPTTTTTLSTTVPTTTTSPMVCPIEVDCKGKPIGQKIPIPILEQCVNGFYCECSIFGLILGECPFNVMWPFDIKRLDADTLQCVKSEEFDCKAWIADLTTTITPPSSLSSAGSSTTSVSPSTSPYTPTSSSTSATTIVTTRTPPYSPPTSSQQPPTSTPTSTPTSVPKSTHASTPTSVATSTPPQPSTGSSQQTTVHVITSSPCSPTTKLPTTVTGSVSTQSPATTGSYSSTTSTYEPSSTSTTLDPSPLPSSAMRVPCGTVLQTIALIAIARAGILDA